MSLIKFENDNVNNDFLTENVSLFLYSIIRTSRPLNILECGLGYSTLFLSQAIEDVKKEKLSDINPELINEHLKDFLSETYSPSYIAVDNNSKFIEETYGLLKKYEIDQNVKIIESDFLDFIDNDNSFYDLIWLDYGDKFIFEKLYKKLTMGGFIVLHSTVGNLAGRLFITEMKLLNKISDEFEMISFFEPHKKIQNSFTIFKKNFDYPMYTYTG